MTDDFKNVKTVRDTIMNIVHSNGMKITSRDGEIVIEKIQVKITEPPIYVGLYE